MRDCLKKTNTWTSRPELGSKCLPLLAHICYCIHAILTVHRVYTIQNVHRAAFNKISDDLSRKVETMVADLKDLPNVMLTSPGGNTHPSSTSSTPLPAFLVGLTNAKSLPPLCQADFKNLLYWFEEPYKRRKGGPKVEEDVDEVLLELEADDTQATDTKPKSSRSEKATSLSCFLEDKDGKRIPPGQQKALLAMTRAYWQFIFENGKAPLTSSAATIETKMEFRLLMESNFECLRYCDSHWKVERLWTGYYPTWLKGALRRAEEVRLKAEEAKKAAEAAVIVVDDDEDNNGNNIDKGAGENGTGKRNRTDDDRVDRSKRPRIEEVQPAPAPVNVTVKRARVRTLISVSYMRH